MGQKEALTSRWMQLFWLIFCGKEWLENFLNLSLENHEPVLAAGVSTDVNADRMLSNKLRTS